ncbi:MAG: hypothetical protein II742_04425 [Clostridia bacterium]|nr:hypothetical protein [Clostridia bacterium]
MNEDIANIQLSPVRDYNYAQCFEELHYNGKTLSDKERRGLVTVIDDIISHYSDGIPLMYDFLESTGDQHNIFQESYRIVVSVIHFVLITMADSMVATKYFLIADRDYDKRFMRGKLRVIINEGFKRLYGFTKEKQKTSEWGRLSQLMQYFPETINNQYQELTFRIERHAYTSSWWKEERDLETHMDTEKLYVSRQEEIIESKVMMDSVKLFNTFLAVHQFLTNTHACLFNFLVEKYKRGELKDV